MSTRLPRLPVDMQELRRMIEIGQIKEIKILPNQGYDELTRCFAIAGPIDTPYEGFWFRIEVSFTIDYPYRPPKVKMLDKIWNPFFDYTTGEICIDIFYTQWSPAYTITKLLLSIISLLSERQINLEESSFLNPKAAIILKKNPLHFKEEATKFSQLHCYEKYKIYEDKFREVPRQQVVEAEGQILNNLIETEEKDEILKKRKLLHKQEMEKQVQRLENLRRELEHRRNQRMQQEEFPSLVETSANSSNVNQSP